MILEMERFWLPANTSRIVTSLGPISALTGLSYGRHHQLYLRSLVHDSSYQDVNVF